MIGYGNSMFLSTHGILARSASAPTFSFLLDTYSGAAVAYSLRKLRSAYTGNCIQVRRSSDQTAQDIGFVNNVLDTASLLTFVGAGNGFVTTWYDQSGNGNNSVQTTAINQPFIVFNGVLYSQNSKPSLYYQNGNMFMNAFRFAAPNINFSFSIVNEAQNVSSGQTVAFSDEYTAPGPFNVRGTWFNLNTYAISRSGATTSVSSGVAIQSQRLYANSLKYLSNNTAVMSTNGTSSVSTSMLMSGNTFTEGSTNLALGRYQASTANGLNGHISEFICYRNTNADIDGVRNNQITFYNIV